MRLAPGGAVPLGQRRLSAQSRAPEEDGAEFDPSVESIMVGAIDDRYR